MAEKPRITLTIDSAEHLPVAEAVIAALYGVKDCLADLQHEQLLQALVIADMIDLQEVADQILEILDSASKSEQGLSAAALNFLADLSAWPACLHQLLPSTLSHAASWPVVSGTEAPTDVKAVVAADKDGIVQRILLAVFGDLQAVWQNAALAGTLMQLPLPAMQLLLSSDKLQVPSEDTVLYTAQQYVESQQGAAAANTAAATLLSLVRAPFLSDVAVHIAALPDTNFMRLGEALFAAQLKSLISLIRLTGGNQPTIADLGRMSGAPKSWLLGGRQLIKEQPAVLEWQLPVAQLSAACKKAAEQNKLECIASPLSPPMGALPWQMTVHCTVKETGVQVGFFVGPGRRYAAGKGVFLKFTASVNCSFLGERTLDTGFVDASSAWGWPDYFGAGPMQGGWDEVAWAAKGLPTSGDLVFNLKMLEVW